MLIAWPRNDAFDVNFIPIAELDEFMKAMDAILGSGTDPDYRIGLHLYGLTIGEAEDSAPYCAIRHWLVTSNLVVLNVAVHFVFRRPALSKPGRI